MLDPEEIESFPVKKGVVIWSLGGPSLAVRTRGSLLYVDLFTGPAPPGLTKGIPEVIDPAAIRWADMALSTHQHEDHCHQLSLSFLHQNTESLFLGPASCNALYRDWGFEPARTRIVAPYETFGKGDATVRALPAKDGYGLDAVTFLLDVGGVRMFEGGDTSYFPEMAQIGRAWDIDIAFLNYAKNPPDKTYYMDETGVLCAARDLSARIVILKHFDLWVQATVDPRPLIEQLRAQGHDARTLGLGERLEC